MGWTAYSSFAGVRGHPAMPRLMERLAFSTRLASSREGWPSTDVRMKRVGRI